MTDSKSKRSHRVAERVKGELMELLIRGVVRDPAVADCFVTDVRVTDDLQQAWIYVRLAAPEVDRRRQEQLVAALNRAAGFIRHELSPKLQLKYQPQLRFFWDENVDQANRVEALLAEIEQERAGGGKDETS